jgi:L-threonylcarbamoyladenylate synthase
MPETGKGIYLKYARPIGGVNSRATLKVASPNIQVIQMPTDLAAYAAALYERLHQADDARVDWIAVDQPPTTPEWEAVHDRLRRAATRQDATTEQKKG